MKFRSTTAFAAIIATLVTTSSFATEFEDFKAQQKSDYEQFKGDDSTSKPVTQPSVNTTNISDISGEPPPSQKPPNSKTLKPVKEIAKSTQEDKANKKLIAPNTSKLAEKLFKPELETRKTLASQKPIKGPNKEPKIGLQVSESTIGAPCATDSSRCQNSQKMICRSSSEGKRMAYWWEAAGSCDTTDISNTIVIKNNEKQYREFIDYTSLYQKSSPAVVVIYAYQSKNVASKGTGAIINDEGLIITNAHVVADAQGGIDIYLKPETLVGNENDLSQKHQARIIAINQTLDLALLKIESTNNLPTPLSLSTLKSTSVGEPTVAIGHPTGGAFWSLTTGRIGASFINYNGIVGKDVFQTETALNPGNSGGPLLDGSGAIIGINSFINRTNASGVPLVGLNFAIKATSVQQWIDSLSTSPPPKKQSKAQPLSNLMNVSATIKQAKSSAFISRQAPGQELGGSDLEHFLKAQQEAFKELEQNLL